MAKNFSTMDDFKVGRDTDNLTLKLTAVIAGLETYKRYQQKEEEERKKAAEREKKAEEREKKAEERKQLMIKQMEVQSQLTQSIQDLVAKIDDLEGMLRSQSGSVNPAQQNNTSVIGGIVDMLGGGSE